MTEPNRPVTQLECAHLHETLADKLAAISQAMDAGIQNVRVDVQGVKEEVRGLKEHQITQNGSVNELKLAHATMQGVERERQRWEERESATIKWMIGMGLVGAGVISGIVFGVLTAVAK